MPGSVIVAGARTPIGKLSGALASLSAVDLGSIAIAGALERAGMAPDLVERVIMGQVVLAGSGQVPARQAAAKAGIPLTVPSISINKACPSGLYAIFMADQLIAAGEADVVVAGGMESMTGAPHLLRGARGGFRYGGTELEDALVRDGLACSLEHCMMGESTERDARALGIPRQRQDDFAAKSHERAAAATKDGRHAEEIVPVAIPQRRGEPVLVETDEGVRPGTTIEALSGLRPAFSDHPDATVTAGNSSQISDGASAVVVTSKAVAERLGVHPLGEVVSYGEVAGPDASLLHQPSRAIRTALDKARLGLDAIDVFEINEAFAAVGIASMDDLGLVDDVVNVNGGAVAMGHPVGASGNRLALSLLLELRRRGGGLGVAALCGGGGQGDAMVLRTL